MTRSRSGQHKKVEQARAVVAQALGDAVRRDGPQAAKFVATTKAPKPPQPMSEAIGVLTVKEAAMRLGISTSELEALIATGRLAALPTGFTRMIPTTEVERMQWTLGFG